MRKHPSWPQLLSIAGRDFKAATHDHAGGYYEHAAFCLQQGVEKMAKAIGVTLGVFGPHELRTISHKPIQLYNRLGSRLGEVVVRESPSELGGLQEFLARAMNFDGEAAMFATPGSVTDKHLDDLPRTAASLREQFGKYLQPGHGQTPPSNRIEAAFRSREAIVEFFVSSHELLCLMLWTSSSAVVSRYGSNGLTPADLYADIPLVRRMPEIIAIAERLMDKVRRFLDVMQDLEAPVF